MSIRTPDIEDAMFYGTIAAVWIVGFVIYFVPVIILFWLVVAVVIAGTAYLAHEWGWRNKTWKQRLRAIFWSR